MPAFSATTLTIPDTPKDNFEAIVANSREYYARPRMEVEAEIRETIEQSERYKRELADSGRQEAPKMVIEGGKEKPIYKVSPNTAEGKTALGLKDLASLVAEKESTGVKSEKPKKEQKSRRKGRKEKKKVATPSPVHPEVEYQEKSATAIQPTHHSLPLSTPVERADHHASKDNSVDGFLAIKH